MSTENHNQSSYTRKTKDTQVRKEKEIISLTCSLYIKDQLTKTVRTNNLEKL